ncbi:MAG TPA: heavy-metal-associated domain-containing protein [Pseudohongiella sp.]|nr:heavy-metal-associated domain-containing protein [Pseudohongiella sp.]
MYQFNVPDMSCGHCVKTITSAITEKDAGASVQCDLAKHQVSVQSQLDQKVLAEILTDAGYPPAA